MKNKVISLLLAAAMCISICSCGKNEQKPSQNGNENDVPNFSEEQGETEPTGLSGEQPIKQVLSAISEERLWVSFGNDESADSALIDTDGNVKFVSTKYLEDYTEVHNGVTFITIHIPGSGEYKNEFYVLDKDGKEIKKYDKPDGRFDILAAEGGKCLVYEMEGGKHHLHIVDSNGEFIYSRDIETTKTDWLSITCGEARKVSDGIYVVYYTDEQANKSNVFLVNFSIPNIVHAVPERRVRFKLGNIYTEDIDESDYYQVLPVEAYADDDAFAEALKNVLKTEGKYHTSGKKRDIYDVVTNTKGATIDYLFEDGYILEDFYTYDGYVFMVFNDKALTKSVFTVTDLQGKKLYDLKPYEKDTIPVDFDDGNLILNDGVILKSGERVSFDNLPSGFAFKRDIYFGYGSFSKVGDRDIKENRFTGVFGRNWLNGGFFGKYYIPRGEDKGEAGGPSFPTYFQTIDGSKVVKTINLG